MNYIYSLLIFFSAFQIFCGELLQFNRYANVSNIERDLHTITKTELPRNYRNIETLNFVAECIYNEFSKNCDTVYYQPYMVNGHKYKNVIGVIGKSSKEKIVVGAHYDVCDEQEGADDNASGIVGLLELSRLLKYDTLQHQIELVAYTLEEPPFFRTEHMGSYIHAKSLYDKKEEIKGMICLEMIGYFSEEKKSQNHPIGLMKLFYGNVGDFIMVVRKFGDASFGRKVKNGMKKQNLISTKSIKAPIWVQGIDFSDHLNYWKFDFPAVMITNTAFYRNINYHEPTDRMETLNLDKMAAVIDEVYLTLKQLK